MKNKNIREQQFKNLQHPWKVGDLCNALYNEIGAGVIYRVVNVKEKQTPYHPLRPCSHILTVVPVHGVISDISHRKTRMLNSAFCQPLSIVDLATEYAKLGTFIADEVKRMSEDK
jgi:hypothetical protein